MAETIIIENGTTASVVRKSIENRAQLQNKGDIYIGTGNKIEQGSTIPDTKGQNIIDAINDNSANKDIRAGSFTASGKIQSATLTCTGEAEVGNFTCTNLSNKIGQTIIQSNGAVNTIDLRVTAGGGKSVYIYGDTGNIQSNGTITAVGNITSTEGEITAQSFNAKSDKRLKENIEKYSPKQSVLDLPVYSYNFIKDTNKTQHIGCLAQDLQKICPEIVHEGDNGFLSIEENKIIYLLLDEVKKLKKRVDELEAK